MFAVILLIFGDSLRQVHRLAVFQSYDVGLWEVGTECIAELYYFVVVVAGADGVLRKVTSGSLKGRHILSTFQQWVVGLELSCHGEHLDLEDGEAALTSAFAGSVFGLFTSVLDFTGSPFGLFVSAFGFCVSAFGFTGSVLVLGDATLDLDVSSFTVFAGCAFFTEGASGFSAFG